MKTAYELLKKYVDIKNNPEDLAEKLTMIGPEVEGIEKYSGEFEKVVVGEISVKAQHPNADKLSLCQVNVGLETVSIVCGAKNHQQGDKVAVALVGAELPGGFKIKKAKLRGELSVGMICSKSELGLEEKSDGVWILSPDAKVGESINSYLPKVDYIYDISLTSNRSDCLSTLGIAREVAMIERKVISYPSINITENGSIDKADISIEDADLCPRYTARIIKGVQVKESPEWMQEALIKYGSRPINNIVDITNYVLFEFGHPLHSFDYNRLDGHKIIARRAKKGEKITTLDGSERELDEQMLVIADANKAVAVAGVMGGENSEVYEDTVDILLEAAYFHPASIRKTAKKLGLRTEASHRFERDMDPENTLKALDYATSLILELAGGQCSELTDNYAKEIPLSTVPLRRSFLDQLLGFKIDTNQLEEILTSLNFKYEKNAEDYTITFPSYRRDCSREVDAVEEIIRVYGYDKLPESVIPAPLTLENFDTSIRFEDIIRDSLVGMGLTEAYNFSFMSPKAVEVYNLLNEDEVIHLKNPLTYDYTAMRTNLFSSLSNNLKNNNEKSHFDIALFEIGRAFSKKNEDLFERKKLGIILSGNITAVNWASKNNKFDFYYLKGIVDELLTVLKIDDIDYTRTEIAFLHPGKIAEIKVGGETIGYLGEVHPEVKEELGLKEDSLYAELDVYLLEELDKRKVEYKAISKFPASLKEIAFIVDESLEAREIEKIIWDESKLIQAVNVYDVYKGKPIAEGKKSIGFSFLLQSVERTLTDEEIATIMNSIINKANSRLGAQLREG